MNDILFGNNNKAVIKKLANRSFRSNKMRNVIAAIAIALTTFLFTAVLTIGMGASGTLEYSMAKMMGSSADALVQGLSEDQFQQLKENAMFEKVGCWIPVEIMTNTNRRVAEVDYADQTQLEIRMLTPRTGSAPQKANEVLVSANILKDLNIEEKIGAEIPVELKVRQSGQVYHFDMVVSGIYDTPNEKSESVIVSKAFLEENAEMMSDIALGRVGCGIYIADVVMRDSYMVKDRISELVRNIGGNPDDVNAANAVRVAPNPIVSSESGLMMWLVAGVFGILFMFCGYLLIYNVFEIAVTNDIRQYGLLRTVGTTSRQIRRLVNQQALYLFLIGTPFGLLFGTLLGRSILPAALQIFAVDFSGGNIEVAETVRFFTTPVFNTIRKSPCVEASPSRDMPSMLWPRPSNVPDNSGMGEKSQPVRLMSRVSTIVFPSDHASDVHSAESSARSSAEDISTVSGSAASAAPDTERSSTVLSSAAIHRFIPRHLPSSFFSEMLFFQ